VRKLESPKMKRLKYHSILPTRAKVRGAKQRN